MNYIQQHSFSNYDHSDLLSFEHYIPDQKIQQPTHGSGKYFVQEKCYTLQSELQEILELNDKFKVFASKLNRVKNKTVFDAFNILRMVRFQALQASSMSYYQQQSSLQSFVYNLHNSKLFLDLIDLIIKRKEQKKMIEAFMKIKTVKKKVVIQRIIPENSRISLTRWKPAFLLIKSIFNKKKHHVFLKILRSVRAKRERSIHSAFTDISLNSHEIQSRDRERDRERERLLYGPRDFENFRTERVERTEKIERMEEKRHNEKPRNYSSRGRTDFYDDMFKEHGELFSKRNREKHVHFRK